MSSKNIMNEKAYKKAMQKYIKLIKPHFKFDYSGFNSQGVLDGNLAMILKLLVFIYGSLTNQFMMSYYL